MDDKLITITDEEFDRLHKEVYETYLSKSLRCKGISSTTFFKRETGLDWSINFEDLIKGIVTLKVLNEQRLILARLKYEF